MNRLPCLATVLSLGLALNLSAQTPRPVAFDWLEYAGTNALPQTPGPGEFQNPILTGFYPDPSICRAGDDYYLINSTFAYFPGIPVFHSRDLVNWRKIGHVIHRPEQLRYDRVGVSQGIFAPAIEFHDGVFYVVCTQVGGNGNFVVTATNPAGPWSDPVELRFEGIDPSLFFDEDGRAWMINNGAPEGRPLYDGHRAIWIQEFDWRAKRMIGPRKVLVNGGVDISKRPIWIEGPHIYKRGGWYYLSCAEGGTGPQHSQVIFRSRNVDGPYTPWEKNPVLTQRHLSPREPGAVTCVGHADYVIGPDGNWWAVFLGVRPYQGRFSPMGRETFLLPVDWPEGEWPMILTPDRRVPLVTKAPSGAAVRPNPELPLNGDFGWRDDFDGGTLSSAWIMLRTPKETWWKLEGGKLLLTPRAEALTARGNPSFFGRRVQHPRFTAALALAVPDDPGVDAGLAVFQGERHHYFARVRRERGGVTVALEQIRGQEQPSVIASETLAAARAIRFRIAAHDATCGLEFAADDGSWQPLAKDLDATMLTTDVAGGFVGATVGPHVRTADAVTVAVGEGRPRRGRPAPGLRADASGLRINVGATEPFTDADGNVWQPDRGFEGGETLERESDLRVSRTPNPALFRTERYSMAAFACAIPNGNYVARLHFAETFEGISGPGERVFSFTVQGREFKDFDVWVKAGGPYRAYVETVPVTVTNGEFRITFTPQVENPMINALEILPAPGADGGAADGDEARAFPEPPEGIAIPRGGIARGRLEMVEYDSKTVGTRRQMQVYTPPGFSPDRRYPVLYLLHGIGGDETEWQRFARVDALLDNLIADGKAAPMIVVMPNGRAQKNDRAEGDVFAAAAAFAVFERDLLDDVIPAIEARYPAARDRESRALAGLSMGGGQALNFGLGHLDTFAWVGAFSPAPNTRPAAELVPDPAAAQGRLKLLWLSCGKRDGLMRISRRLHDDWTARGLPHVWNTDDHGHDATHWRNNLWWFAQKLFR